ncbi:MAG: ribokinase [Spirochaetota bacterium]
MSVLSFGSLNIDHVYSLPHIVRPGETIVANEYAIHPGGKGLNQSLAMARAGLNVFHAGRVGKDGLWLRKLLESDGVDCRFVESGETHTGHAMIQVSERGENSIVLYGGANQSWTEAGIKGLFSDTAGHLGGSNWQALVCQNEANGLPVLLRSAYECDIPVIFNAAPYSGDLQACDLSSLHTLLVNETEAMELARVDSIEGAFAELQKRYPKVRLVMTLGADGVRARQSEGLPDYSLPAFPAQVVDSTAAGDTFAGYYVAALLSRKSFQEALAWGSRAGSLAVSRAGAAPSIPYLAELQYESNSPIKRPASSRQNAGPG